MQGASSYLAPNGQPQWVDIRVAVGANITIDFYVDGVLHSTATAANTQGKGKPVQLVFANTGLHGTSNTRSWSYAHFAVLDGVSTIGRRFVRRTAVVPLIAMLWLSACGTGGSDAQAVCPLVVDYNPADQAQAVAEVETLSDASIVVRMLSDYAVLRDQARTCR